MKTKKSSFLRGALSFSCYLDVCSSVLKVTEYVQIQNFPVMFCVKIVEKAIIHSGKTQ